MLFLIVTLSEMINCEPLPVCCLFSWHSYTHWEYQPVLISTKPPTHTVMIPLYRAVLFLGNTTNIRLTILQKQIPLANLSATRKYILKSWLDTRIIWKTTWLHYYLDILIMECPLGRLHKASATTVLNIVEFIKEVYWWFCLRLLKSEYDLGATANYS